MNTKPETERIPPPSVYPPGPRRRATIIAWLDNCVTVFFFVYIGCTIVRWFFRKIPQLPSDVVLLAFAASVILKSEIVKRLEKENRKLRRELRRSQDV